MREPAQSAAGPEAERTDTDRERSTVILLVRHTDVHNPDNVLYGRLPGFRLSEKGIEQARQTARALADEPIVAFFSSPMLRARQTTSYLAEPFPGVPVKTTTLLAEMRTSWQGTPFDAFAPDFTCFEHRRTPTDESAAQVAGRMLRFLRFVHHRYSGNVVVGVSHGDPIKFALLCAQGWPATGHTARQPDPARGSITRFVYEPGCSTPSVSYREIDTGRFVEGEWERLGPFADLPSREMRVARAGHRELLVARSSDGALVITSGRCPHMRAHLCEGSFDGTVLTCPLHGAQYDLVTGKTVREAQCSAPVSAYGVPDTPLKSIETGHVSRYATREKDGYLWVRIGW